MAGTKLEALLKHLVVHLPEGRFQESLRTQLIRIGLHIPDRTKARSRKASADSDRDCPCSPVIAGSSLVTLWSSPGIRLVLSPTNEASAYPNRLLPV